MRRVTLVAVFLLALAAPAWADFQAAWEAYERGDYATALREWRPLAEQGDATAQFNVGLMYVDGLGVPKDYAEAVRWLRKAAEQGDTDAQNYLGVMYDYGPGVPQDYVQAHMWYNLAAARGNESARKNREMIAENMTTGQIAEAQRLAREWKPKTE